MERYRPRNRANVGMMGKRVMEAIVKLDIIKRAKKRLAKPESREM